MNDGGPLHTATIYGQNFRRRLPRLSLRIGEDWRTRELLNRAHLQ
jgi:hypothetical protein